MLLHRLSLADALRRLSRRFKLRAVPVVLADGAHAIDVDNRRTFDVAAHLLERRGAATVRMPETRMDSEAALTP